MVSLLLTGRYQWQRGLASTTNGGLVLVDFGEVTATVGLQVAPLSWLELGVAAGPRLLQNALFGGNWQLGGIWRASVIVRI